MIKVENTKIPVADKGVGYIPIADICVGDRVFDEKGDPVRVTEVSKVEAKEAYNIVFNDDSSMICSADQMWSIRTLTGHFMNTAYSDMSIKELVDHHALNSADSFYIPLNMALQRNACSVRDDDCYATGSAMDANDPTIVFPNWIYDASEHQRLTFLQGIMDNYGYMWISDDGYLKCYAQFHGREFAEQLLVIVKGLGIRAYIRTFESTEHTIVYRVSFICNDNIKPMLFRKHADDLVHEYRVVKYYRECKDLSVQGIYKLHCTIPMISIKVQSPKHLYQVGYDHLVIHD